MLGPQGKIQGQRVDAVIFDGIPRPHHLATAKPRQGVEHVHLHVVGQAGAHALHIHFPCAAALRLDEQLVPLLVPEPHQLILDAGAIPGARARHQAAVHGAAMDVFQNDLMGLGVGIGKIAGILRPLLPLGNKGKPGRRLIPVLGLHFPEIQASPADPGRGAGLEPADGKPQPRQGIR